MYQPSRLAYLYLLRNPLLLAFFLVGFPYYAAATPGGHSLARGAFDLQGWQAFLAALSAFLAGWTALINSRLILLYGEERFGLPKPGYIAEDYPNWWMVSTGALLGVPTVLAMASVYTSEHEGASAFYPVFLPGIGGFIAPILILYAMNILHRLFRHSTPDHLVLPRMSGWLERPLNWATARRWPYPFPFAWERISGLGPGYLFIDPAGKAKAELKSGHWYALAVTIACLAVYEIIGYYSVNALACLYLIALVLCLILSATSFLFDYFRIPALLVVIFWIYLVAQYGWLLGPLLALTVLALWWARRSDRRRVPGGQTFLRRHPLVLSFSIILAMIWVCATIRWPMPGGRFWPGRSEHYFQVESLTGDAIQEKTINRNLPYDVLQADTQSDDPIAILVAAPGGGIHAAAWTAKVLVELEKACRDSKEIGGRSFGKNIRLISSVSGGSVGTMYFVNAYRDDGSLPPNDQLDRVVKYAEASSLDPAVKGLVYPDFMRTVIPYFDDVTGLLRRLTGRERADSDRGQWLQDAWVNAPRRLASSPDSDEPALTGEGITEDSDRLRNATLASWRRDVAEHRRPAVIFNSSNADTGGRYLLATTGFYGVEDEITHTSFSEGRLEFAREHPDVTVKVATAARLSATFPYVSPAACADLRGTRAAAGEKKNWRLADGGYTNNSGMNSLGEWLEAAMDPPFGFEIVLQTIQSLSPAKQASKKSGSGSLLRRPRILIIQIRNGEPGEVKGVPGVSGWAFQMLAPLTTLTKVWSYGQTPHDDWEIRLLKGAREKKDFSIVTFTYSKRTAGKESAPVQFDGPWDQASEEDDVPLSNPLSWHLTRTEKVDIDTAWGANGAQVGEVINFMKDPNKEPKPAAAPTP